MSTLSVVRLIVVCAFVAPSAGAQTVLHQFDGLAQFDFLGAAVAGAGDVNADGHADLIAGGYGYNGQGPRAIVFSGANGAVLHVLAMQGFGDCSGAGDVDGDGFADLIVGETGAAAFGPNTGRATVYSGQTGLPLHVFEGSAARDSLGASVGSAGDVDGDGRADLIVGAPQNSNPPGPGYARVFSGTNGALLYQFDGDSNGDAFGYSVDGAGDVDADGRDDLIVGARLDDNAAAQSGMARVFSGNTGAVLWQFDGAASDDWLGQSVAGAGDVNLDGYDDVVVGVPGDDTSASLAGSVRVFSGLDGSTIHVFHGAGIGQTLGSAVDGAGDLDGDGFADLVAGAPGGGGADALVWSGRDGTLLWSVEGEANLGSSVGGAGDVNGDCFDDVIVGDPVVSGQTMAEIGSVFVYAGLPASPATSFCFGDGTGAACPCGNSGCLAHGCANSAVTDGGHLRASGTASVSADTLTLFGVGLPPTASALFIQGTAQSGGGLGLPISDGLLCVGGNVVRLGAHSASNGAVAFGNAVPGDPAVAVQGGVPAAGGTRHYQIGYRDAQSFCTAQTYNFTNAVTVTWSP